MYYNVSIGICFAAIGIMIILAASYSEFQNWLMLGIAIGVSIILFVISLKIDRTSASRLLILLDNDRRKVIDFLSEERTFEEIRDSLALESRSKSNLASVLSELRKLGFIQERNEYVSDNYGKRRVKKFIRSF